MVNPAFTPKFLLRLFAGPLQVHAWRAFGHTGRDMRLAITLFVTMVVANWVGIAIARGQEQKPGRLKGEVRDVNS